MSGPLKQLIKGDFSTINLPLLSLAGFLVPTIVFIILIINKGESGKNESLGQYGDFFGGFSNPLLTFLTFLGVLYTVYLQREALSVTKVEASKAEENLRVQSFAIAKQNFEATVFQMLNLHNSITSSLNGVDGNYRPVSGRAAIAEIMNKFSRHYANSPPAYSQNHDRIRSIYMDIYNDHRNSLSHYYRMLFNIVKFIDENCPISDSADEIKEKMTYARILRAQMSDAELVLMFYNVTAGHGTAFRANVEKFDILDNLDESMLFHDEDRNLLRQIRPL